jgi:hypothetical protein
MAPAVHSAPIEDRATIGRHRARVAAPARVAATPAAAISRAARSGRRGAARGAAWTPREHN